MAVAPTPTLQLVSRALTPMPGGSALINAVDYIVNWARASSLWPLVYGTSCCAIEMMATGAARHDISRFGAEVFRASPRQADLIILAGTLTEKMSDHLKTLYEQMPAPKYVIAMGACTISGGPFYYDNYSVVKGADRVIPVDVFIPGCPPRPEALLNGLVELQNLIRKESIRAPRVPPPLNTGPLENRHAAAAAAWKEADARRQEAFEAQREQWLADHPDYQPYKHQKVDKPKYDEVERRPRKRAGSDPWTLYQVISAAFGEVAVFGCEEPSEAAFAEWTGDTMLQLVVPPERYQALVAFLKNHAQIQADLCLDVTAIDWQDRIEVVTHLLSTARHHTLAVRCKLAREAPEIDTIVHLYPGANWHERETWEMFGVVFSKHPDLRRLLLPDSIDGHPMRKDFSDPSRVVERPY